MKTSMTYAMILSLSVASAAMFGSTVRAEQPMDKPGETVRGAIDKAQDATNGAVKSAVDPMRASTNTEVDAKTASDIRSRLASIVNNAVSVNGFDDLIGSFDKADRQRIGLERFKDFSNLNSRVTQFRKDFHDKYNQDFDFKSAQFNDLQIMRGADKDHATVTLASMNRTRTDINERTNTINDRTDTTNTNTLGNPRTDDKHPDKVLVTEVKPSGEIDHEAKVNADKVHNPDIKIEKNADGTPMVKVEEHSDAHTGQLNAGNRVADVSTNKDTTLRVNPDNNTVVKTTDTTVRTNTTTDMTNRDIANRDLANRDLASGGIGNNGAGLMTPIQLNLHDEGVVGNGWRLDIPDTLSAASLSDSLSSHLKMLSDNKANWPADVNQAYRVVAHHVFQAIEDVKVPNLSSEK